MSNILTIALALGLLLPGTLLQAQVVSGVVITRDEGQPLDGVLVLALDSSGRAVSRSITRTDGRFNLRVPSSGLWSVRAERIGYGVADTVVEVSDLRDTDLTIEVTSQAVDLPGIEVASGPRCSGVTPVRDVARVWQDARSILSSVRAQGGAPFRYKIVTHSSEVMPDGGIELGRVTDTIWASGTIPMRAAPAEDLALNGFTRLDGDTAQYYAPDAEVLLSDVFLANHCFDLIAHDDDTTMVGLRFRPVPLAPTDIEGTFWIPTDSRRGVAFVEFDYLAHPWDIPPGPYGGRVVFQDLEGPGWIVQEWWIRIPVPRLATRRRWDWEYEIAYLQEWGATVVGLVLPSGG